MNIGVWVAPVGWVDWNWPPGRSIYDSKLCLGRIDQRWFGKATFCFFLLFFFVFWPFAVCVCIWRHVKERIMGTFLHLQEFWVFVCFDKWGLRSAIEVIECQHVVGNLSFTEMPKSRQISSLYADSKDPLQSAALVAFIRWSEVSVL